MYKSPLEEMMGTGLHVVEYKAGTEGDISNILVNSGIAVSAALLASGVYWISKKVFGKYFEKKEDEKKDKNEKKAKNNTTLYKQFSIPTDETNIKEVLERVQKVIDKTNNMLKGKEYKFPYIKFVCILMGKPFKVNYSMEETKNNISKMFKTEFMSEMKSDYITPDGKVMFFNIKTCNITESVDDFQSLLKGVEVSFAKTKDTDDLVIVFSGPNGSFGLQKKDRDKHLETFGELGSCLNYIFDNFENNPVEVWSRMIFDCLYEGLADNRMWIQWCFEENLFKEFGFPKKDTEYYIRPDDWEWGYLTTFVALKKKTDEEGTESMVGNEAFSTGEKIFVGAIIGAGVAKYIYNIIKYKKEKKLQEAQNREYELKLASGERTLSINTFRSIALTEYEADDHVDLKLYLNARKNAIKELNQKYKNYNQIGPFYAVFKEVFKMGNIDIHSAKSDNVIDKEIFAKDLYYDKISIFKEDISISKIAEYFDKYIKYVIPEDRSSVGFLNTNISKTQKTSLSKADIESGKLGKVGEWCKEVLNNVNANTSNEKLVEISIKFVENLMQEIWLFIDTVIAPDFYKLMQKHIKYGFQDGDYASDNIIFRGEHYKEPELEEEALYIPIIYSEDELEWIDERR